MTATINLGNKKWITIFLVSLVVLLALSQVVARFILKTSPNLVRDEYGIVYNGAAKHLVEAQREHHEKNGVFAHSLMQIVDARIDVNKFSVGYVEDFPREVKNLCPDCTFDTQRYKAIIAFKEPNKISLWSIDEKGDFKALGYLPVELFKK